MVNAKPTRRPHNFKDVTGQEFGRLRVLRRVNQEAKQTFWLCRCECGGEVVVLAGNLRQGISKSCGCLQREVAATRARRHGMISSPEYSSWKAMRSRCNNPNATGYERYGGRGIEVCERWQSFENFLADMGKRPAGTTLERKDNDAGYGPGNCRWATRKEQASNRRPRSLRAA